MNTRKEKVYPGVYQIGTSFLAVLFVLICLLLLGVLSLSGALRDKSYSDKTAEKIRLYYAAVSKAQHKLGEIDKFLDKTPKSGDYDAYLENVSATVSELEGIAYRREGERGALSYEIPMTDSQVLSVELEIWNPKEGEGNYKIVKWQEKTPSIWKEETTLPILRLDEEKIPLGKGGNLKKGNSDAKESGFKKTDGSKERRAKVLVPVASGVKVYGTSKVSLDVSNASEGYIILRYNGSNPKVKLQLQTPKGIKYTYSVTKYGNEKVYPLTEGSGTYSVTVYEAVSVKESLYAAAMSKAFDVNISKELMPFLYPNDYVDFDAFSACVAKGEELAKGCASDLDVVESVYGYMIENITYDYDKAATVQPGYVPYPDNTLTDKTGICFDYASLMSAMLRSQQIPTRLEVGYVGELYHAWISCYIKEIGWVDGIIRFDGKGWTMMDPTMAAGNNSKEVLKLQKEAGYVTKYMY